MMAKKPRRRAESAGHCLTNKSIVSQVTCRLVDWCGEECERCGGRGEEACSREPGSFAVMTCLRCHGIGRIGGHGIEIVKVQPVTEVRITDGFTLPDWLLEYIEPNSRVDPCVAWAREKAGLPKLKEVR